MSLCQMAIAAVERFHRRIRAGPEKAELGGDSQTGRIMIHPTGWEEASMDGKTLFAGYTGTHNHRSDLP